MEVGVVNGTRYTSIFPSRIAFGALLYVALPAMLAAQASSLTFGVLYTCPAGQRLKVFSCAGAAATAACDVQAFTGAQPGQRGPAPRGQVMAMVQICHLQTPAEAQADARGGATAPAGSNGIAVGENIEVTTAAGWTPARVLAINGNSYRVLVNGVQVNKDYPAEVRRVGAATAQDHANGQYRLGDRVQVNVQGRSIEGKIVAELGQEYQVELPGNRTVWANPQNLRPAAPAPAAAAPKTGVPPKPGLVSCAGKIEGRYATGGNFGSFTITFRSGKATMTDVGGTEEVFECWTGGEKIYLHKPQNPNLDMPIDINNDGTLQTPLGEIKKKGN
jgi:hypothetical protein